MDTPLGIGSLPTDSLYKYLALSGVLLLIASLYFSHSESTMLALRFVALEAEMNTIALEQSGNGKELDRLGKELAETNRDVSRAFNKLLEGPDDLPRREQLLFEREVRAAIGRFEFTQQAVAAVDLKSAQLANQAKAVGHTLAELNARKVQLGHLRAAANWGAVTGGALAFLGFFLWYFKLQRYQDEILRREAAQRESQKNG